jgi:hypothetical protein
MLAPDLDCEALHATTPENAPNTRTKVVSLDIVSAKKGTPDASLFLTDGKEIKPSEFALKFNLKHLQVLNADDHRLQRAVIEMENDAGWKHEDAIWAEQQHK